MNSEFYEQLGVDRGASSARIRSAYGSAVAKLTKRARTIIERGGDASQVELQRARLDEAWEVLSHPVRRRRYDAMLRWSEGNHKPTADELWAEVQSDLVHPAAAVAAKLLRVTTELSAVGELPLAPSGADDEPPTLIPHDDDLTQPAIRRIGPSSKPPPVIKAPSVPTPRMARAAPPVITMPKPAPPPEPEPVGHKLDPEIAARLLASHGPSGALIREARVSSGLSIEQMAEHTRISVRYLEAIELEAFDALPSATFVRGYVREVARTLGLDLDAIVAGYMRRMTG